MKLAGVEALVRALNDANVRFIVVGGLAVNAHGYGRATYHVDLVVPLTSANVEALFTALGTLGYRPLVPVSAEEFGDAASRERLITEKGMVVLQFHSEAHRETRVDVFAREPFDFDAEYGIAYQGEIAAGLVARFAALDTLIRMKEATGRPMDADDAQHLRWIREDLARGG